MSNKRHKYFNKVPPFNPDHEHYTRKQHSLKEKESYDTDDDAWKFLNKNPRFKEKDPVVYRCSICNKFHISIHHKNKEK